MEQLNWHFEQESMLQLVSVTSVFITQWQKIHTDAHTHAHKSLYRSFSHLSSLVLILIQACGQVIMQQLYTFFLWPHCETGCQDVDRLQVSVCHNTLLNKRNTAFKYKKYCTNRARKQSWLWFTALYTGQKRRRTELFRLSASADVHSTAIH